MYNQIQRNGGINFARNYTAGILLRFVQGTTQVTAHSFISGGFFR